MQILTKNGKYIHLEKHGRKRLAERLDLNEYYMQMVKEAWERGTELNAQEREYVFRKGCFNDRYWESIYLKYRGHTYVFRLDQREIIFVTIL